MITRAPHVAATSSSTTRDHVSERIGEIGRLRSPAHASNCGQKRAAGIADKKHRFSQDARPAPLAHRRRPRN